MTDLRDLMDTMLLDEPRVPVIVDHVIQTGRRRRRRHRVGLTAATMVVVAAVATTGVMVAQGGHRREAVKATTGAVPVRCDQPSRVVQGLLDWPCLSGTETHYDQVQVDQLLEQAAILAPTSQTAADFQLRVLGFGSLPNSRPGSSVVYAEVWLRDGTSPAEIVSTTAAPVHFWGRPERRNAARHGIGPNAPLTGSAGNGQVQPGQEGMFVQTWAAYQKPNPATACEKLLNIPVPPRTGYPASCTDTVIARQDITAIRTVHPDGQLDAPVPVVDGLAGLTYSNRARAGWTIQGLDSSGAVVATVPYRLSR